MAQTPVAVTVLFPGEAEAIIGGTQLEVTLGDEFVAAVNRVFGANVVELG